MHNYGKSVNAGACLLQHGLFDDSGDGKHNSVHLIKIFEIFAMNDISSSADVQLSNKKHSQVIKFCQ